MAYQKFARGLSGDSHRAHQAGSPEISKEVIWCQGYIKEVGSDHFSANLVSMDGDLYQPTASVEHLEPSELEMLVVGRFITAEFFEVNPGNISLLSMSDDLLTVEQMVEADRAMQGHKAKVERQRAILATFYY